jgi:Polyketide cyclase / dehydrase and lipid transport
MPRRHREATAFIAGSPESVFAFVDDHSRLSSHMSQSSWMMGGGEMRIEVDEWKGQAVGSHIRLAGTAFGLRLFLDEIVTRRDPPTRKEWETVGTPRLLVIGSYAMGVEISADGTGSRLRVFIDYDVPGGPLTHWLGVCFGGLYARWCVKQMIAGAAEHFGAQGSVVPRSAASGIAR